jgi:hypothetical protein
MKNLLFACLLFLCTSCALGSGVSGISAYSLYSKSAEGLTPEAEDRIVNKLEKRVSR